MSIELKQKSSLKSSKKPIKLWKPVYCPCRMCQTHTTGVRFLQVSHFLRFLLYARLWYSEACPPVFTFFNYVLYLCVLLT